MRGGIASRIMLGCVMLATVSACASKANFAPITEAISTASSTSVAPSPTATAFVTPAATTPAATVTQPTREVAAAPGAAPTATGEAPTAAPTATATKAAPTQAPSATPAPAAPVILSFTADRTAIAERETVILRWTGQGATAAAVWWFDARGLPSPPVEIVGDPNNGSAAIHPDASPIHLTLRNAAGEAEATITLDIHCVYAWIPELAGNPNAERCPGAPVYTAAAQQWFEHGFMVWIGNEQRIYVFYDSSVQLPQLTGPKYRVFVDNFREGDPETDPTIIPPEGRTQPVRGFGLVWRTDADVRNGLGWALAPETGGETWAQNFAGVGRHNTYSYLRGLDGQIYLLAHFDGRWELYR